MDSGKSQTGLIANKFGAEFPDAICQHPQTVDVGVFCGVFWSVAPKDASRCGAKVLFERLIIRHGIHRLILNLDCDTHFGIAIQLVDLFEKVLATVKPGSR